MNPNFIPLASLSTQPFDLDAIQIASPCRADWNAMSGDEQTRHCKACAKNVYNLSALTREQATRLIAEKEGNLCVHLHLRADGTIITSDCSVGISSWKKPHRALGNFFVAGVAAVLGVFGVSMGQASERKPTRTLGAPMVMGRPAISSSIVDGEMSLPPGMVLPPAKTAKKSAKNHAKSSSKAAIKFKSNALKYRRHRR